MSFFQDARTVYAVYIIGKCGFAAGLCLPVVTVAKIYKISVWAMFAFYFSPSFSLFLISFLAFARCRSARHGEGSSVAKAATLRTDVAHYHESSCVSTEIRLRRYGNKFAQVRNFILTRRRREREQRGMEITARCIPMRLDVTMQDFGRAGIGDPHRRGCGPLALCGSYCKLVAAACLMPCPHKPSAWGRQSSAQRH